MTGVISNSNQEFESFVDVAEQQWNLVRKWHIKKDSMVLRYGPMALSVASGITGFFMNSHYRSKLKLKNIGRMSTYVPLVVMPAALSGLFHHVFISTKIIVSQERCAVCTEMRAVALQLGVGVVYPLILAPAATYMLANRYNSVRIPDILNSGKKALWDFHINTSRKLYTKVPFIIGAHVILSALITYGNFQNFYKIREQMIEIEKEMTAKGY